MTYLLCFVLGEIIGVVLFAGGLIAIPKVRHYASKLTLALESKPEPKPEIKQTKKPSSNGSVNRVTNS